MILYRRHLSANRAGFTLIEIVLVLTLILLIVGVTIPSFKGIQEEKIAREQVTALAVMAKETRLRAMKEKRPYQIALTSSQFAATRYLSPYLQAAELTDFLASAEQEEEAEAAEASRAVATSAAAQAVASASGNTEDSGASSAFHEWTSRYTLPAGVTYSVKLWHEETPTTLAGDLVKLWVFQPSGMVEPMTVKFLRESASYEAEFSALTADVVKESSGTP